MEEKSIRFALVSRRILASKQPMPDWVAVIILGIIEGITEFIPVSSTGHLLIAERWLPRQTDLFNVVIQCGAVVAQEQAHDEVAASLRVRAEEVAKDLGISVRFIAAHGDAYRVIKRIADEERVDAIVVGASAKAGHKLIGSLAVRLVRAGKWPVTVVPLRLLASWHELRMAAALPRGS